MYPEYPSPYFLYDPSKIAENVKKFKKVFPQVELRYALKSNPLPLVVTALGDAGSGFEIASRNELKLLLKSDIDHSVIIYSNPVKAREDIVYAFQRGITTYSFDSPEELDKLAECAPGAKVILRLRVYERGSVFSLKDKFGVEDQAVVSLAKKAIALGLDFIGLSFHVGSQSLKLNTWKYAMEKVTKYDKIFKEKGIPFTTLNLGGGFPHSYKNMKAPELTEIGAIIKPYLARLKKPHVYAEPGRYLVANSAILMATVVHRTVRRDGTWLYLDAGTYNALFEAMAFQGSVEYRVEALGKHDSKTSRFILAGPTCDSIDTIDINAKLPADLGIGDRLVFHDVGSYTNALANSFNGFSVPKIYQV